jgi:hypothetical protein
MPGVTTHIGSVFSENVLVRQGTLFFCAYRPGLTPFVCASYWPIA